MSVGFSATTIRTACVGFPCTLEKHLFEIFPSNEFAESRNHIAYFPLHKFVSLPSCYNPLHKIKVIAFGWAPMAKCLYHVP
jgi:hypothetical protein